MHIYLSLPASVGQILQKFGRWSIRFGACLSLTMALPMPMMTNSSISAKYERLQILPHSSVRRIPDSRFSAQTRSILNSRDHAISNQKFSKEESMSKSSMLNSHKGSGLRIAYQGVSGAYSEVAAMMASLDCFPIPCRSITDAIDAVENGLADRAIVPVESTMEEGHKVRNYELLLERSLNITQEINLFVNYCLLAIPGVRKREVKRVISHPLALAHCGQGLARLGLTALHEAVDDTAGAVELLLSQHMLDAAVIASPRAADLYSLQVLAEGVQDESWNVTRFLILSKSPERIKKKQSSLKTSMIVGHEGGLHPMLRVLSSFSSRNTNLTKLEVKSFAGEPVKILDVNEGLTKEFEHVFYVDFEGSTDDPNVNDVIAEISTFAKFSRILGCYPADSKIYDLR